MGVRPGTPEINRLPISTIIPVDADTINPILKSKGAGIFEMYHKMLSIKIALIERI